MDIPGTGTIQEYIDQKEINGTLEGILVLHDFEHMNWEFIWAGNSYKLGMYE